MTNYEGLNPITPTAYDADKALAGEYGAEVQKAFEEAATFMRFDGNVDGKLSDGEIDYAVNQITSDDNDPINMDDAKDIARTYGGEDRLLSLDEMAQVYLDGVLETSSDSDGTTVTLNRSRTSQAALLSGYMSYQYETDDRAGLSVKDLDKATDHFNRNRYALTEDQARLLIYAYGTNGNLVGSQLQQMFSDNEGVVSTQDNAGEAVELAIDLSKMPSRNVANLLMYKDYTDEGGDYNGEISYSEFDHATDNIFGDDSIVTEDQAKLLADAYGASGSLVRDEIKAMIDDGVLTIKTNSEGQLRGELKLYHIPSSRIADGLLAFGSNGHLTADELRQATSALGGGSGLNQDQARNIIYAWGSGGRLSSDALKEVLDDGAITLAYGGGGVLDVRYNPAAFTETGDSSRRQANILMFKDFTGTNPDDRITAEEFDHATDELFGDDRVVTEIQADALAGAYGTSGSLTRDDVKAMIEDGLLTVTSDDDGKLSGALHLDQWPSSRIPDALLAFDSDGNDTLDSVELARGLLAISGDDERRYDSEGRFLSSSIGIGRGIPTPEEGPHKKFANLILEAAGGKERGRDLFASLADDGVITGGHGDSAYEAPAASTLLNSLVNLPDDGSSALSPELFKYFNTDALPGENGTITQLAFSKVLLDYKDAPKGSLEHTYHDLNKVKYFATHDAPSGGLFRDLKKEEIQEHIIDLDKVNDKLEALAKNPDFSETFRNDMAEELNKIIGDHFVLSQGKIKLRENGDGDVPPVDGQTWARAMLSYTKTPEAVQSYKAANDEGKAQFIDTYFRDMGSMLPQDEVSFALEDFDDALEYDDILNSDFSDVTDDELGTALKTMVDLLRDIAVSEDQLGRRLDRAESRQQLSSDWLLNVRRPVKWIENTLQLTTNDYKQVARAITANKAFSTDDPAWVDKAIASLGSSSSSASAEFLRFLNGSGLIGTVAGGVGVMGLALHYRHNDAAYDRLNSGDTRERFAAARSAIGIASYAVSYGKAIAGGAELIGEFADWSKFTDFATEYRSLPGLGRIVGSASKLGFQPAFEELATQLSVAGTNLKDQASVLRALGRVDTSSGSAFADIGFDFGPLASKIKAFATDDNKVKALTGVAPGSGGVLNLDGRQVVAMLYDITGVDEDYKYILRADTILEQAAANVNPLATGKTQLYEFANLLSQNGMSDAEITKVADELQYATTKLKTAERLQAATQPSTEIGDYNARSKLFERALNSGIPFDDIIGNQTYRDLKHTAVTARAREQALIKPLDDAETALAAAKTARDEARNVMIVAQTAFWDALDKATTADAPFPVAQRDAFITSRDAYNSAQAAVTAATQDRDNLASAYNDAARAARSAEGDVARAVPGQTQRVPAAQYNLDARISDQYMKRNVNPAVIKVEAPEGGAVRYAYGPVLKTIGAATDLFGGALDIGLGIWDINTAVNEADGPDGLGITIGSLEISTGIAGGLAGAAAFGLIPAALSTPFLVISGGISTVNLVISAINSQQFTPPRRLFEESIAENFSDPSVVREGAFEYLDQYESELEFSFDSVANEAAIWG